MYVWFIYFLFQMAITFAQSSLKEESALKISDFVHIYTMAVLSLNIYDKGVRMPLYSFDDDIQ